MAEGISSRLSARILHRGMLPYILVVVILFILPLIADEYILYVMILTLLYSMLAASYDLVLGYSGQLSFCQGAFYGIGAYASALLTTKLGLSFYEAIILSIAIVSVVAAAVGFPALRLRGAYFAVTTFFLAHFVYLIFLNEVELTGGPLGLRGIRPPEPLNIPLLGTIDFSSTNVYYYFVLIIFLLSVYMLYRLVNSNIGKILISIREDEDLAEALGINTAVYKLFAFVVGAIVAGVAGALFAHYFRLLHPTTFSWLTSEMVVIITIVGGAGTLIGPILGAGLVMFVLELLRFAPELRYVLWAAALIALLVFEPKGLVGLLKRYRRGVGG